MTHLRIPALAIATLLSFAALATAQSWTALTHEPTVPMGTALLLTDGTVMAQQMQTSGYATGAWWRLTPDITGSYANGTWSQLASMPSGYAPLYYASAVLPDGRLVVEGGEYNNTSQSETNLGAIYNPATNSWTSISPPSGWSQIGDASSVVLPNGTMMIGNCCSNTQALLNASTLTWTTTGSGKADSNSEEGWTLLPNNDVLTVDVWNGTESELYSQSTGKWTLAGSTGVTLPNNSCHEIGPAVLRPGGTVFATGGTNNTAIYNYSTAQWSTGPAFPSGDGIDDGPGALLPDGNVLTQVASTSSCYAAGLHFYEFNGTSLNTAPLPPHASTDAAYVGRMLVLPTGQILYTDGTTQVELYTPTGTYQSAWQPKITSVAATLTAGSLNNSISGTQFNGLSQGAMYGDNAQMATNYPLVRIKNNSTGHIFYVKTHNHSTMGVATGTTAVSTQFDIPGTIETGASTLVVVANGIPSSPANVTVQANNVTCSLSPSCSAPGGFQVDASATLSCSGPSNISLSVEACINGTGCSTQSSQGYTSSLFASTVQDGPYEEVGGYCYYTWSYNGQNYSETLNP